MLVELDTSGHVPDVTGGGDGGGGLGGESGGRLGEGTIWMNAYGGAPPPVDQPGFVALLKSKAMVAVVSPGTAGARIEEFTHLRSSALSGMAQ